MNQKRAFLQLHIAVLLWGFTGIFGKEISLTEIPLVWWRMLFTVYILGILVLVFYLFKKIKISFQNKPTLILTGFLVMLHWLFFYGSIKHSNISIALCCLSVSAVFSAILSPIFFNKKFDKRELIAGFISIIGIMILLKFQMNYYFGIMLGIIAAILSSIFTMLNEKLSRNYEPLNLAFSELLIGFILLSFCMPFIYHLGWVKTFYPTQRDLKLLLAFSSICTVLPFILSLYSLKSLSAFTVNLSVNLEPVYGILAAFYLYHEYKQLNLGFYIGFSLVLFSLILHILFFQKQK